MGLILLVVLCVLLLGGLPGGGTAARGLTSPAASWGCCW